MKIIYYYLKRLLLFLKYLFIGFLSAVFSLFIPAKVKTVDELGIVERGLPFDYFLQDITRLSKHYDEFPAWVQFLLPHEYLHVHFSSIALLIDIVFWTVLFYLLVTLYRSRKQ